MDNAHIYKMIELVGSSTTGIEDAIQNAIKRASKTVNNLDWFEVSQLRGFIENNNVKYYQVGLKVGFRVEE